ncbi:SUMF1/EgtB/PvdO family nonheme iron enzyme [Opitutales bacterium]|nr:SUMF1/EgtB/PvdO family nonheme iron enzyme [Opitutales bacterium]
MKNLRLLLFLFLLPSILSAAPVPYSGKVAINGLNFQGNAQFTFALRDANGTVHWRNGADANSSVTLNVDRGLYVCLLGGHTMNDFPENLFLQHPQLFLVVHFFRPDIGEWLHLQPDQLITSAPHALAADVARNALTADAVKPGAITKNMLAADVLADLNATVVVSEQNNTGQIVSITRDMLPWDVLQDLNGTITRSRLSADVLDDLNQSIKAITRDMLPWDVLQDLNGTIARSRLSADVLADLNRTIVITRDMLPADVLAELNATVVVSDQNTTGQIVSITRDMLPWDVLQDLNGTISRSRLSVDVLDDLNQSIKAITRDMLPWDVLQDLNGTITRSRLSVDVLDDLNQSIKVITRDMLPWDVLQDLNGTISRSRLPADVLQDLNRTVTKSMLGQDVLADLNRTVGKTDLDDLILMYLRPEITAQPQLQTAHTDSNVTFGVSAEGKYLSYQWQKNGFDLAGETSPTLVVTEANASLHDGNYSVVVSNDFGSVTSQSTSLQVEAASMATTHTVQGASNLEMIWVEPGTFTMGSPTSEAGRNADREDEHTVTLTKGFYLGKYEVTQAQYQAVMTGNSNQLSATPSQYTGNDRPVEKVSWDDAQIFLTRLNAAEQAAGRLPAGWSYVLPTESEWEYACRAGTTTAYSWGNSIAASNANYSSSGISQTRDVGQYAANPWGFHDMHGNVMEWTADWYQAAYPSGTVTDPTGPASGSRRVRRGGSWNYPGTNLRSAERDYFTPGYRSNNLGFRVGFKASQ